MALEGTLRDFSLADIFQLIGLQRKTGVLTLKGKDDTVTVTFLDGKVVAADSLNKRLENRLGHLLVRTGYITNDQLNRALDIQKETLQRLGFILTHHGILSVDQLREALQLQILQIIYRLFRWKDGEYHFSQETVIEYDRDHVVPITAESILMEGARMIDEWPILEKRIRSYDMVFRKKDARQEVIVVDEEDVDEIDFEPAPAGNPVATKKRSAEAVKISSQEKLVYDLVDGKVKVAEIVDASRFSEFDTVKALYELSSRDLIEEVRAQPAPGRAAPLAPAPVEAAEVATVVPLPLILLLVGVALGSLATSSRNPLNPLLFAQRSKGMAYDARKAVSLQRIDAIGTAIEAYNLANGRLPASLEELTPDYLVEDLLVDPWGHQYKFIQRPDKYLVIGFLPDGKPDTDLFLSQSSGGVMTSAGTARPSGGITLID